MVAANVGGQKPLQTSSLDKEVMNYDYRRILRKNRLLEEDNISMVTITIMYATHKRVLMDEIGCLGDQGEQWPVIDFF